MKRFFATNIYPNIKDILVFVLLFVLLNVIFSVLATLLFFNLWLEQNEWLLPFSYTGAFASTIAICSIYRRKRSRNAVNINAILRRHNAVSPYYTLWALVMIIAAGFSVEPLAKFFPESMSRMYDLMSGMKMPMVLVSVFVAPIVEEVLFRGIIQSDLQRVYSPRVSILITSLIFGVVHLNLAQSVSAFVLSTVIGYVYYKTKSLWVVIFIHFFNNALAQTLFILYSDKESYLSPTHTLFNSPIVYYCILAVCLAITLAVIIRVAKLNKVPAISQNAQQ